MTYHAERSLASPILRISDEVWEAVRPILAEHDPPRRLGRKRIDQRRALDAVLYRLRTGCRWNSLPKEYPDDSSVHRTYQRWQRLGVLDRVLAAIDTHESSPPRPASEVRDRPGLRELQAVGAR